MTFVSICLFKKLFENHSKSTFPSSSNFSRMTSTFSEQTCLNSITTCDFSKISLLEAYNVQHKFDMIYISETYRDSVFPNDDPRLMWFRYTDHLVKHRTSLMNFYLTLSNFSPILSLTSLRYYKFIFNGR